MTSKTIQKLDFEAAKRARLAAECRKALAGCPHKAGTVYVDCLTCAGVGSIRSYQTDDNDFGEWESCPRCCGEIGLLWPELCPCTEPFDKATILEAIADDSRRYQQLAAVADEMEATAKCEDVRDTLAAQMLAKLRNWCETNKTIVLPDLFSLLVLRLLEKGMIQCQRLPSGEVVFTAKGAKEEVCRFPEDPELAPYFDISKVKHLREFAYRKRCFTFAPTPPTKLWDGRVRAETIKIRPLDETEQASGRFMG